MNERLNGSRQTNSSLNAFFLFIEHVKNFKLYETFYVKML